ncbi:hypothetical protein [Methyloterricola oryzae]|uniref:hypothetical protein n=1 Tax=Methyloterricola oryzae TaxID=1495050 RepID=UPI001300E74B|nr:hypothetical protein [Methyloterricola oryzae]
MQIVDSREGILTAEAHITQNGVAAVPTDRRTKYERVACPCVSEDRIIVVDESAIESTPVKNQCSAGAIILGPEQTERHCAGKAAAILGENAIPDIQVWNAESSIGTQRILGAKPQRRARQAHGVPDAEEAAALNNTALVDRHVRGRHTAAALLHSSGRNTQPPH